MAPCYDIMFILVSGISSFLILAQTLTSREKGGCNENLLACIVAVDKRSEDIKNSSKGGNYVFSCTSLSLHSCQNILQSSSISFLAFVT